MQINGATFTSYEVVWNGAIPRAMHHFLLVVCSKNVSILHHLRDITTFIPQLTRQSAETLSAST